MVPLFGLAHLWEGWTGRQDEATQRHLQHAHAKTLARPLVCPALCAAVCILPNPFLGLTARHPRRPHSSAFARSKTASFSGNETVLTAARCASIFWLSVRLRRYSLPRG